MSRAGLRIVDCLTSSLGLNILGVCFSFLLAISLYTVHDRYRDGDRWLTDLLIIFHSVNQTKELTSEPIISGGGLQYCLSHTTVINDFSEQFEPVPANSPVMWERSISRYSSACSHCGCWTSKANRSADLRPSRVQGNPCTKQRHQAQFQRVSSQICFCQFDKENVIFPPYWVLLLSWHQGAMNPPTPSAGTAWALSYPWHEPVRGLTRTHGKKPRHHQHARSLPLFV